jgi:hypothetical protein
VPSGAPRLGGVLLRVSEALVYVRAADAVRLAPIPSITRVPGAPEGLLGVALHEGEIFPVVSIGEDRQSMVVCAYAGSLLGVVGGSVVATGMFDAAPDGVSVLHEGETATALDLARVYARTSPPSWGGRWLG